MATRVKFLLHVGFHCRSRLAERGFSLMEIGERIEKGAEAGHVKHLSHWFAGGK
jgi:hypothetical protein